MTKNKAGGKQNSEKLLDFFKFGDMKELADFLSSYTEQVPVSMNRRQLLHYMVLDIIFAAESFILDIGGDPSAILPSQEDLDQLLPKINSPSSWSAWARDICSSLIAHRDAVRKNKYGEVIRRAKEFIAAHYADNDISLKTVAEAVGMSACRFSTVFSQNTGTTFIDYITQIRISHAMELLKSSPLRASEITYAVGYSDPHYFSYIFKKTTGKTPTEFRGA
jgi:two-component system, response regulator YesN